MFTDRTVRVYPHGHMDGCVFQVPDYEKRLGEGKLWKPNFGKSGKVDPQFAIHNMIAERTIVTT